MASTKVTSKPKYQPSPLQQICLPKRSTHRPPGPIFSSRLAPPKATLPSHPTHHCVAWRLADLAAQVPQSSQLPPSKRKLALSRHAANLNGLKQFCFFFLIVDFVWTEICLGRFGDEEEEEEEHHRRHHQQHRHHHHCLRLRHRRHSDSDRNNKREFDRGCCLHPGVHGVIRWRIMRKLLVGQYKWLP